MIAAYNEAPHSSLRIGKGIYLAPNDVTTDNSAILFQAMYGKNFIADSLDKIMQSTKNDADKIKENDHVRLSITKKAFTKASEKTFSDEVFQVDKVLDTYPTTFKLKDSNGRPIIGSYYKQELLKI